MPAKKSGLPAAEVKAEREKFRQRAAASKARFESEPMLTTIAVYQSQTLKKLEEISKQLKETNQTLLEVLSALNTVH